MANWTQKKLLAVIGGSAVGICMLAAGGVYYAQGLIEEVEAQVKQKREGIAAADAKIAKIPALQKDVIVLRENLDEYVRILPDTRELTNFVRQLNQFERQSGINGTGLQLKSRRESKTAERFVPIEYTYEGSATMWQALKFMNLVENYRRFVSINEFSITSGGGNTARAAGRNEEVGDREAVHQVRFTLQTYTYNGKTEGKEAPIPDYQSLKEVYAEDIWKSRVAIGIEGYEHKGPQGRRDILVDPRERGDVQLDGPSRKEQRELLDRYVGTVTKMREMLQRARKPDTTLFEVYSLEKGVREGLEKLAGDFESDGNRISYAPFRLRWAQDVAKPIEELRTQLNEPVTPQRDTDPYLPIKDLQQLVADMDADCKSGQLDQAKSRYEAVATRLAVPASDARHDLVVQAKSWHVKAVTALDFKALDLKIQGVVVNRGGRSGVLVNGETYEEGDYVSDDLLVKMVEEEQVWFVFRGLTLVRTM
jgi:Tfp pilus assembly protein PilO